MLSAESANSEYPVEACDMEARISKRMEQVVDYRHFNLLGYESMDKSILDAICYSAISTSLVIQAKVIVTFSKTGIPARKLSRYLPYSPIINVTETRAAATYACLAYGVESTLLKSLPTSLEQCEQEAVKICKKAGVTSGSIIVLCGENEDAPIMKVINL